MGSVSGPVNQDQSIKAFKISINDPSHLDQILLSIIQIVHYTNYTWIKGDALPECRWFTLMLWSVVSLTLVP